MLQNPTPTGQLSNEEKKQQILIQKVNELNEKNLKVSPRDTAPPSYMYARRLPCPLPKGSSSKSIVSPPVIASPQSPARTSSSPAVCSEKYISPMSSEDVPQPLVLESSGQSRRYVGATLSSIQAQLLALGTHENSALLSPQEPISVEESQNRTDKELGPRRLIEAVRSISPEALASSVEDMMSAVMMMDSFSGPMPTNSEHFKTLFHDLAADVNHSNVRKSSFVCEATNSKKRPSIKERSVQLIDVVLEEIEKTNQKLIETAISLTTDHKEYEGAPGVVVRCSFTPVGLSNNNKFPILVVDLFVPEDYPKSSPRVMNLPSLSCSETRKNDFLEKAMTRFNSSIRKLSEPFSLKDMAKAWNECARSVLLEFAESTGGGSFSSTYGTWRLC